jgi:hypothetical protein
VPSRIIDEHELAALPVVAGANGNGHELQGDGRSPWAGPAPVSGGDGDDSDDDADDDTGGENPPEYPRRIL